MYQIELKVVFKNKKYLMPIVNKIKVVGWIG